MRSLLGLGVLVLIIPCALAQRVTSPAGSFRAVHSHRHGGRNHVGSRYGFGYFDPFYWDDVLSPEYPPAAPPVTAAQASSATAVPSEISPPLVGQPLLIELQQDRYIQISGDTESQAQMLAPQILLSEQSSANLRPALASQNVALVYRDGRHEEISSYTIADGILYTSSDYETSGRWTRQIELSALNLPETVSLNQSRGIPFHLPAAPNEVMVGP